jgi:AraC-like DNA-binding protein
MIGFVTTGLARSAASVRILMELATERGLTEDKVLAGTGLDATALADPLLEIHSSQELRLIENLVDELGDDSGIALDAGPRYRLELFGMLGFAFMNGPTLRNVVELSLRYQELAFTLAHCELQREGHFTYIRIDVSELPRKVHRFVVEHLTSTVWVAMSELGGEPPARLIEVSHDRPTVSLEKYRHLFGGEPRFGAREDRIGFRDDYLDKPRRLTDPSALDACEKYCRSLLNRRHAQLGFSGTVRQRLTREAGTIPTMSEIASELNVSVRTLRRILEGEGTSFRELEADARRHRAEELLSTSQLSVDQIADRLGYTSSASLVRASRRWWGCPPGMWRRQQHL